MGFFDFFRSASAEGDAPGVFEVAYGDGSSVRVVAPSSKDAIRHAEQLSVRKTPAQVVSVSRLK